MKRPCLTPALLSLILMAIPATAQEQTLLGDLDNIEHGGFGGPAVRFTQIDGNFGVLTGGRGGWIINHRFVLGGGGYGLANPNQVTAPDATGDAVTGKLEMGYGGGLIEYVIASNAMIHGSVELLVGAGGLTTQKHADDDAFFVIEPGANLMLNITQFFRLGAGVSYRSVHGANFGDYGDDDLTGVAWGLLLKFGSF